MRSGGLNKIFEMAKSDERIIFIGSDLGYKVLENFKNELPQQFFMEGISEANIVGMACGLSMMGKIVYINTIATFLTRRCYEQICIDLCLENQKVRLFANGGGLIYGPMGPTHTTLEDISIMMSLPNMAVVVPNDKYQMLKLLEQSKDYEGPIYFRVARDNYPDVTSTKNTVFGEPLLIEDGRDICIISNGFMTQKAINIRKALINEDYSVKIIDLHTLHPLNLESLWQLIKDCKFIVTMEEAFKNGGIYSIILDLLNTNNSNNKITPFYVENKFFELYGEQHEILEQIGLSDISILSKIKDQLSSRVKN